jgi:hypothetical protein
MTIRRSNKSQATRDGALLLRRGYGGQSSPASRAYSPVGPRTFTGFTSYLVPSILRSAVTEDGRAWTLCGKTARFRFAHLT